MGNDMKTIAAIIAAICSKSAAKNEINKILRLANIRRVVSVPQFIYPVADRKIKGEVRPRLCKVTSRPRFPREIGFAWFVVTVRLFKERCVR
jgi:hypothetical protein